MSEWLVDVAGVSRRFGSTVALDNVTFRAKVGQVHGLVGANGAGKTTLIKHILGLLRARSGKRVFGLDPVRRQREVLQRIGYLSEELELPEWMRINELMRYTQAYYPNWKPAYAQQLLANFGLNAIRRSANCHRRFPVVHRIRPAPGSRRRCSLQLFDFRE